MKSKNTAKPSFARELHKLEFGLSSVMIKRFVELTGDNNSLHTDKEFARRSMYRGPVFKVRAGMFGHRVVSQMVELIHLFILSKSTITWMTIHN